MAIGRCRRMLAAVVWCRVVRADWPMRAAAFGDLPHRAWQSSTTTAKKGPSRCFTSPCRFALAFLLDRTPQQIHLPRTNVQQVVQRCDAGQIGLPVTDRNAAHAAEMARHGPELRIDSPISPDPAGPPLPPPEHRDLGTRRDMRRTCAGHAPAQQARFGTLVIFEESTQHSTYAQHADTPLRI